MFFAWQYWQSLATHEAAGMSIEALRRQRLISVRPERRLSNLLRDRLESVRNSLRS